MFLYKDYLPNVKDFKNTPILPTYPVYKVWKTDP